MADKKKAKEESFDYRGQLKLAFQLGDEFKFPNPDYNEKDESSQKETIVKFEELSDLQVLNLCVAQVNNTIGQKDQVIQQLGSENTAIKNKIIQLQDKLLQD